MNRTAREQPASALRPWFVAAPQGSRNWLVFVVVLLLGLGFLAVKTWREADQIRTVSGMRIPDQPGHQPGSPAHRVIVPAIFIDSYQWLNNAQTMAREGVLRVRRTDLDNAPYGREEPWHSGLLWWTVLLGWVYGHFNGMATENAIEFAAVYANPLLFSIGIVILGVLVTLRWNGWLGAILVAGMLAANSGCEPFQAGYLDHHGVALTCAVSMGLFALMAGAGWVARGERDADDCRPWLPRSLARRWMIASAVMGGAGMWISPFSQTACITAVGTGAILSVMIFGRGAAARGLDPVDYDPTLWRLWGRVGGLACLFFYLLEYFPGDLDIQLEVNNPFLALAWWGAGELVYQLSSRRLESVWRRTPLDRALLALAAIGVLAPAALVAWGPATWFVFRDAFAWRHHSALYEFKPFTAAMSAIPWRDHLAIWGVLPLALLTGLVFLFWKRLTPSTRGWLIIAQVQAMVLGALFLRQVRWGVVLVGPLQVLVLCQFAALFFGQRRQAPWASRALATAYLATAFAIFPGMRLLDFWRDKHLPGDRFPVPPAMLLVFLALACILGSLAWGHRRRWSRLDEVAAGGLLAATFGVFMAVIVHGIALDPRARQVNVDRVDVASVILRDVAGRLNAMSGPGASPVVLSDPNSSLLLAYFGNLRAVGTNYWSNREGLKDAAAIYAAQSDEAARDLLRARQVRYVVLFSENRFAKGYFKLSTNGDPGYRLERSFGYRIENPGNRPPWLRHLPYPMPAEYLRNGISVHVYEVLKG